MSNKTGTNQPLHRLFITLILVGLLIGSYIDLNSRLLEMTLQSGRMLRSYMVYWVFAGIFTGLALIEVWKPGKFYTLRKLRNRTGNLRWVISLALAFSVTYFFIYSKWGHVFTGVFARSLVYLLIFSLMSWLAVREEGRSFEWGGCLVSAILLGTIFSFGQVFSQVSDYPFSLGWSEGNRLWDYSISFGRRLYIYPPDQIIPVYTDRIRQSLWGLPYLAFNMTIWQARLWGAIIWTLPYALLSWICLALGREKPRGWFVFGLWVFLFLEQGPVYSTIVLAAILIAITRRLPTSPGLLLLILAGTYAQLARWSWVFAPSIWYFIILYLQQTPINGPLSETWLRRAIKSIKKPLLLSITGLLGSYGLARFVSRVFRGEEFIEIVGTSWISTAVTRQALLWDRLLPNSTFPPGIILGLLVATGPLAILIIYQVMSRKWKLDLFQGIALLGSQTAFLIVGLIASVKIGGGSNLHNLDMFLLGIVFAACLAWENGLLQWMIASSMRWWWRLLIIAIIIVPAIQGIFVPPAPDIPDHVKADAFLEKIRTSITDASHQGDVLFLDQRQLLTFGYIKNIPLVADYEKKLLMDEAMAGNQQYFSKFNQDLSKHRFAMIVSEPLWVRYQGEAFEFGNENDAWVKWVSTPILCYYRPLLTDQDFGVQLLVPKIISYPAQGTSCP